MRKPMSPKAFFIAALVLVALLTTCRDDPSSALDIDSIQHVGPLGNDSAGDGTAAKPFATISKALSVLSDGGITSGEVRIQRGTYSVDAPIDMVNGISLLGGFNNLFSNSDPVNDKVTLNPSNGSMTCTLRANGINTPTVVEGFIINGPDVTQSGTSSTAVLLTDCDGSLTLTDCIINAGSGGTGADGSNGIAGRNGLPAQSGSAGFTSSSATPLNAGGAGGSLTAWDDTILDGGDGGDAGIPVFDTQSGSGDPGGAGGYSGRFDSASTIQDPTGTLTMTGVDGAFGISGSNGSGGAGGTSAGSLIGGVWTAPSGSDGSDGDHGTGGGAGGASGGADDPDDYKTYLYIVGASGGGGGSGGEGGRGGQGGQGGGGSFGIVLDYLTTPVSLPIITGNTITGGPAGNGGRGGDGSNGGSGGPGGPGVGTAVDSISGFVSGAGASGGSGGKGGAGGGGKGGDAVSFLFNPNGYTGTRTYATDNTFSGTGTAGTAGLAGNPVPGGGSGTNGANGNAGDYLEI